MRRGEVDLRPDWRILDALDRTGRGAGSGTGSGPAASVGGGVGGGASSDSQGTKDRLDEILARDQAVRDVEEGRVHPHLYAVLRDAEGLLRPTWSLSEGDRRGLGTLGGSYKRWLSGLVDNYLKALREYTQAQRRMPDDPDRPKLLEHYSALLKAADEAASSLSCQVCVTFGQGEDPRVAVEQSSHRPPFDELARVALLRAARMRRPTADIKPTRACYEFTALFHRIPPLPVVGCSFDESKPAIACYYPTKKILRAKVKLVSARPVSGARGS
jgi:hypothetical protein